MHGHSPESLENSIEKKEDVIELKEILRSKEKLKMDNVESTIPWHDYLLVSKKDGSNIEVFNHSLEKEETTLIKTSTSFEVNRRNLPEYDGVPKVDNLYSFSLTGDQEWSRYDVQKAPEYMQGVLTYLAKKQHHLNSVSQVSSKYTLPRDLKILERGKYLVFVDPDTKSYETYVTTNENGIVLSPENWKHHKWDSKTMPEEVKDVIAETVCLPNEGFSDLNNDKYSAIVTGTSINIVDSKKPNEKPLYSDIIPEVKENIISDPSSPEIIYYVSFDNPDGIVRIDFSGGIQSPEKTKAKLPKKYENIRNFQLDPTGTFFLFYSGDELVLLTKDTLEEISRKKGVSAVNFDSKGNITAVNEEGYLVKYALEMDSLQERIAANRAKKISEGVDIEEIFKNSKTRQEAYNDTDNKHFKELKDQYEGITRKYLSSVVDASSASIFRTNLELIKSRLRKEGLKETQINFILNDVENDFLAKEREFAKDEVVRIVDLVRKDLEGDLSMKLISHSREQLRTLQSLENVMDQEARTLYNDVLHELDRRANQLFQKEGKQVMEEIDNLLGGIKNELSAIETMRDFNTWDEFQLPKYKTRFQDMLRDVPVEANDAYQKINDARNSLELLAKTYRDKFKKEYAKVRESASIRVDQLADNLYEDIQAFKNRLNEKEFGDKGSAEQYISSSESKKLLEAEIEKLGTDNPDKARELRRELKVGVAQILYDVEAGTHTTVAETGQQMVMFGNESFPRYEAKVKEQSERRVEMTFEANKNTAGVGVKPGEMYGDVMMLVTNPDGSKTKSRVFADREDEDEWRLGLKTVRGVDTQPTYMSANEFKDLRNKYRDWASEEGKLKQQYEQLRTDLARIYSERAKPDEARNKSDQEWKTRYTEKYEEYKTFLGENNVALFRHMDKIASQEVIDENGKGFVPRWRSNWVVDSETQNNLQKMAELFKMQLELGEGILNLNGHTGTGKDVLLKMFSNRTNRPYFSTDCTKWTTEFELSEDVMLESKDGATQTIKVPSAVLRGIQTPGSIVYFNEVNGMPEQSQIFLHALWDEKRALTLKTSSGKVIEADPSVLLASSMNPNYPGTFDPQYATKSRMVSMEVGYPDLEIKPDPEDTNKNPKFNSAEAMRIARNTGSLEDLTLDPNLEHNEFVKVWDRYINGIDNDAPELNSVQEFDLQTIKALVQFGNLLRVDFMKNFEDSRESRNALPVKQPITAREFQRCAYALGKISVEDKATADPDVVAKDLLERFFLSHIYSESDRSKIRQTMASWSSKNRVAS